MSHRWLVFLLNSLSALVILLAGVGIQPASAEEEAQEKVYLPVVNANLTYAPSGGHDWPMAGANPQRTSWTSEEVRGKLQPLWYKPFEAYISHKIQIVGAYGNLYISTSRGLYALDAATGAEKWVYPTEMPLGHSPTVKDNVVYVGGLDHKIHAIDAHTGRGLWSFAGGKGFDTNPLVLEGKVFAGNRDGFFYAIYTQGAQTGQLAWKYKTGGPIHYSAAYIDGIVYFASNDSRAYALNAQSGALIWKSAKLPGAGFHSWWPVVYKDFVIFSGSTNYRTSIEPGPAEQFTHMELAEIYPNHQRDPKGTLVGPLGKQPGPWVSGTPTIDTSKSTVTSNGKTTPVTEYFESKPWRRTYFVLNRANGQEVTYDFDHDGKAEYAPILWLGTRSGNRFPPVVGSDGVLYQGNNYMSDPQIAGGHISGWATGTPFISVVKGGWNAVDEPVAYAAGGDLIYWGRCCDRIAGAFDISIPESDFPDRTTGASAIDRSWNYFSYNLPDVVPGYNVMTYVAQPYEAPWGGVFGGRNGSYGFHGDVNPPIPFQGKVFMHRSNAVLAFAPGKHQPKSLPAAKVVAVHNANIPALSDSQIKSELQDEVQRILIAGHLRPGYLGTGIFDLSSVRICGADLVDYFHEPADTIYTLIRALPYLPQDTQQQVKNYLRSEFSAFPLNQYTHIGWRDGSPREIFDLPPEVASDMASSGPEKEIYNFSAWKYSPYAFYALWKYAATFGDAKALFDSSKNRLEPVPADSLLIEMPHVHNAFIAGYWGYLELEKLAGYAESAAVRSDLNRMLQLRASTFSMESPEAYFQSLQKQYCRSINISRNFMYLVPELAQYLRTNASGKIQAAIDEYNDMAPYWFASAPETAFGEGVINHLYDPFAIFQAKALILREPRVELTKYLDVPAFAVGDLFYVQNLISLLEAH